MLIIKGKSITLTGGDTAYLSFVARIKKNGQLRPLESEDTAVFRVETPNRIIEVPCSIDTENDKIRLAISPEDTKGIPFETYKYEVELITVLGEHFTIIADQNFTIGREIA